MGRAVGLKLVFGGLVLFVEVEEQLLEDVLLELDFSEAEFLVNEVGVHHVKFISNLL